MHVYFSLCLSHRRQSVHGCCQRPWYIAEIWWLVFCQAFIFFDPVIKRFAYPLRCFVKPHHPKLLQNIVCLERDFECFRLGTLFLKDKSVVLNVVNVVYLAKISPTVINRGIKIILPRPWNKQWLSTLGWVLFVHLAKLLGNLPSQVTRHSNYGSCKSKSLVKAVKRLCNCVHKNLACNPRFRVNFTESTILKNKKFWSNNLESSEKIRLHRYHPVCLPWGLHLRCKIRNSSNRSSEIYDQDVV